MRTRIIAALGIAVLALTGCSAAATPLTKPSESASATQSPTLRWIQSDAFKECRELYESVAGASDYPQGTCQAMAREYDVDELIEAFSDPQQLEVMRADLESQVAAAAAPAPTQPPAPTEAPAPHVLSDQARHVLDTNLGAGFGAVPALKDQYCTFSDDMLEDTAEALVGMYRDITTADVVAYVNEVCGR